MTTTRALAFCSHGARMLGTSGRGTTDPPERPRFPGRVFTTSRQQSTRLLARPYDRDVPMGCTGDRVWASSPQGWAFRDDVHWLYLTNLNAFDIEVSDEHGLLAPARATYYPSHIHYEGVLRKEMTASASFTYRAGQGRESVDRAVRAPQAMDVLVEREAAGLVRRRVRDASHADRIQCHFFNDAPVRRLPSPRLIRGPIL